MKEHWLIIGATSAIARACIRELAQQGADFTLVGRDLSDLFFQTLGLASFLIPALFAGLSLRWIKSSPHPIKASFC